MVLGSFYNNKKSISNDYFNRNNNPPFINAPNYSNSLSVIGSGSIRDKKKLLLWSKILPELSGITKILTNDIVTKVRFVNNKEGDKKANITKAEDFSRNVMFEELLKSQVYEMIITGESFSWIGIPTLEKIKKCFDNVTRKIVGFKSDSLATMSFIKFVELKSNFIDDGLLKPKLLRIVPSTTMDIVYDVDDVKGYRQVVGTNSREYSVDEIIHLALLSSDGKPEGLPSFASCIVQFELLKTMWDNQRSLQSNSGIMDKIISINGLNPNTQEFSRIKEQLLSFQNIKNKHGTMLFTGDVKVTDINSMDAMQYKEVGLYITGIMALQWSLPVSRIPFMVGSAMINSDVGGVADRGYNNNLSSSQRIIEERYNRELWIPYFGVKMLFDKSYKHNEVVENQAQSIKLSNINVMEELLSRNNLTMTEDALLNIIGLTIDDVKKKEENDFFDINNPKPLMKDQPVNEREEEETVMKREEQNFIKDNRGKPTGVGT